MVSPVPSPPHATTVPPPLPLPLTERVLRRLGPPRFLWVLLWAAVPFLSASLIRLALGRPATLTLTTNQLARGTTIALALWAVRWIAQLGGFMARKGDGEPGPMTLWRGLHRLNDLTAMWRLCHGKKR